MNNTGSAIIGIIGVSALLQYAKADDFGTFNGEKVSIEDIGAQNPASAIGVYNGTTGSFFAQNITGLGDRDNGTSIDSVTLSADGKLRFSYLQNTSSVSTLKPNTPVFDGRFRDGYTSIDHNGVANHFAYDAQTGDVFFAKQTGDAWTTETFSTSLSGKADIYAEVVDGKICLQGLNGSGSVPVPAAHPGENPVAETTEYLSEAGIFKIGVVTIGGAGQEYAVQSSSDMENWTQLPNFTSTGDFHSYEVNTDNATEFFRFAKAEPKAECFYVPLNHKE